MREVSPRLNWKRDFSPGLARPDRPNLREFSDPEIFEKTRFSSTEVKSRLHETAYLNPNLTIHFMGSSVVILLKISLYHEPDGIVDISKTRITIPEALHEPILSERRS